MSRKILIIFGVISALFCLIYFSNDRPREREIKIFDSIKHDELNVQQKFKDINDVERVEKSLFNEYVQKNEENLLVEIEEKINVRISMIDSLEEDLEVYKKDVDELIKLNNAPLLNKETKYVGKSYIKVLEKRINYLDKFLMDYAKAVQMEGELNLKIREIEIEEIIENLEGINLLYEDISEESEGYNEILDELKLQRGNYVRYFNYSDE